MEEQDMQVRRTTQSTIARMGTQPVPVFARFIKYAAGRSGGTIAFHGYAPCNVHDETVARWNREDNGRFTWQWEKVKPNDYDYESLCDKYGVNPHKARLDSAKARRERDLGPALADALSSALGLAEATNARGVASKIRGVMGGVR